MSSKASTSGRRKSTSALDSKKGQSSNDNTKTGSSVRPAASSRTLKATNAKNSQSAANESGSTSQPGSIMKKESSIKTSKAPQKSVNQGNQGAANNTNAMRANSMGPMMSGGMNQNGTAGNTGFNPAAGQPNGQIDPSQTIGMNGANGFVNNQQSNSQGMPARSYPMQENGGVFAGGSVYNQQLGGGNNGSMYNQQQGGSMFGPQGFYGQQGGQPGSMYSGQPGMTGMGYSLMGSMNGSMYGNNQNSMYGMNGVNNMNSMYGANGQMSSMYGVNNGGYQNSMYGMTNNNNQITSMYGMNGMNNMNSMYGANGQVSSMYGMNSQMNSMYGMGGPQGSIYGMNSMYGILAMMGQCGALARYNSVGLMNNTSMYGLDRESSRSSFSESGGYIGLFGTWVPPEDYQKRFRRKRDTNMPPPSSMMSAPSRSETGGKSKDSGARDESETKKSDKNTANTGDTKDESKNGSREVNISKNQKASSSQPQDDKDKKSSRDPKEGEKSRDVDLTAASTHRMSKQINDKIHVICIAEKAEMIDPSEPSTVIVSDKKVNFDEVYPASTSLDVQKSDLLVDICEHAHCGHNVSLICLCPNKSGEVLQKICEDVVQNILSRMKEAESANEKHYISASAAAFPETDKARDLACKPPQKDATKAVFGSNPIYGPCLMNISDVPINTKEDASELFKAATTSANDKELVTLLFKLKQQKPAKNSSNNDVYVSSILVCFIHDANFEVLNTIRNRETISPGPLFANAVFGASRTVVLTYGDSSSASQKMLDEAALFRKIENTAIRSGNVRRFVDFSKRAINKVNNSASEDSEKVKQKIEEMLNDSQKVIDDPASAPLAVYPLDENYLNEEGAKRNRDVDLASVEKQNKENRGKEREAPSSSTVNDNSTDGKTKKGVDADILKIQVGVALQNYDADRTETDGKIKLKNSSGAAEVFEADEVYYRKPDSHVAPANSKLIDNLANDVQKGYNCGLFGLDTGDISQVKNRFTWVVFLDTIKKVLAASEASQKDVELFLSAAVIKKRDVLGDLLNPGTTPMAATVTTSPIYGPVLYGIEWKSFKNYTALETTLNAALERSQSLISDTESFIYANVVVKRYEKDDVILSSFLATSCSTTNVYKALLEKDSSYAISLFACAFGGPSAAFLMVTVTAEMLEDGKASQVLQDIKPMTFIQNKGHHRGSTKAYVEHVSTIDQRVEEKMKKVNSEEEKQNIKRSAEVQKVTAASYEDILSRKNPGLPQTFLSDGTIPDMKALALPKKGDSAALGKVDNTDSISAKSVMEVRTIATVLQTRDTDAVTGESNDKDNSLEIDGSTIKAKGEVISSPTEVIEVKGNSIRCGSVDDISETLLKGFNCSLLTADVHGSSVGRSLIIKCLRTVLSQKSEKERREFYWSLVVINEGKAKDMLTPGSEYNDIHLATSPLFGPLIYGVPLTRLDTNQQGLEEHLREAAMERQGNGGLVAVIVVSKVMTENDVVFSSLLATLAGENVDAYEKVMDVRPKERGLLNYAIGGPCKTIYIAGVHGNDAAKATPLLKMCDKFKTVSNSGLRHGSLQRFLQYTLPTLQILEQKAKAVPEGEKNAYASQVSRVSTMIKDSQAILESPEGSVPPVYKK